MAIIQELLSSPITWILALITTVTYLVLSDPLGINWVPGPLLARFSPLWLFWQARQARRFKSVHAAHKHYGKFVRLSTDHVSINDHEAIPLVYGHGTGTLKAEFYDAFVSIHRGLFNTRDRADHTRKRKIVSHTFSQQNVLGFERYIHSNLTVFLEKMDLLITRTGTEEARFDFLPWANYLAFDIIGDLAFGKPFNFIRDEDDTNNAISVLNKRGEWSATVGTIPWIKLWTPYIFFDPFFPNGLKSVKELAQIAITAVETRLRDPPTDRKDLLSFLINARDERGEPMPDSELKAEALTQLIAGSDTTSNSLTSIIDVLCRNPAHYASLTDDIDALMRDLGVERDGRLASFKEVRGCTKLINCIHESLRVRPTSAMGLPRLVPPGGLKVCGRMWREGTMLSVPSYSVHHDPRIYPDPLRFNPDRFLERKVDEKEFVPFGYGPRACIGRNVAMMELQVVLANLLYRYQFRRTDGNANETVLREGFLLKATELQVVMTRR